MEVEKYQILSPFKLGQMELNLPRYRLLTYLTTKDGSASLQSLKIDVDSGAGGVLSSTDANKAISIMDDVIEKISSERSMLGAKQNRLEFTYNNLMNQAGNLQNAESRIRDADMAKEMMEYTKASMLY